MFQRSFGLIDRAQQLMEIGSFLDRPQAVERGPEHVQVAACEQADSDDPFGHGSRFMHF